MTAGRRLIGKLIDSTKLTSLNLMPGSIAALYAVIAVLLSVYTWVMLPPMWEPDSTAHFFRATQISQGKFEPDILGPMRYGGNMSCKAIGFAEQHTPGVTRVRSENLSKNPDLCRKTVDFSHTGFYPFLAYVPQAIGLRLSGLAGLNQSASFNVGALANLTVFIAITTVALYVLPHFQILAGLFFLLPTSIMLTGTMSADPLNHAIPFLLLAVCWRIAERSYTIVNTHLISVFVLSVMLSMLKPTGLVYLGFLLLPLLNPIHRSKRYYLLIASSAVGAISLSAYWIAGHPFVAGEYFQTGANPGLLIETVVDNPAVVLRTIVDTAADRAWIYWHSSYGLQNPKLGEALIWAPTASSVFVLIGLALLSVSESTRQPPAKEFLIFTLVGVAGIAGTLIAFWIAYTAPNETIIRGVQGRYLTLFFFCLFVAASSFSRRLILPTRYRSYLAIGIVLTIFHSVVFLALEYRSS